MSPSGQNVTSWSSDGFGHQLMAMLGCQAAALSKNRTYVPSVHTRLEHSPPNATQLIDFLTNFPAGRAAPAPLADIDKPRFPDCAEIRGVQVCDHCFGRAFSTTGCSATPAMSRYIHGVLLRRMHTSLRAAFPGRSCNLREKDSLCVHWRQKAGWESMSWIRRRVYGKTTLTRMISDALRNMTNATLVVYTNADASDTSLTLPHVRSDDENPLSILFEFAFCCDGVVLSNSALSALIGFATNAPRSRIGGHQVQCLPIRENGEGADGRLLVRAKREVA